MNIEESIQQIETLIEAWQLDEADLNQTDINAMQALLKENQELKKQLENCYCNRTDCSGRIKDSKVYDSLVQKVETQQKEFIKYLEDEKDRLIKETSHYYIDSFDRQHAVNETIYDEVDVILQKYKEIIGGKHE